MVLRRKGSFSKLQDYKLCRWRLSGGDMCYEAMNCPGDLDRSRHGLVPLSRDEDSATITVNTLLDSM